MALDTPRTNLGLMQQLGPSFAGDGLLLSFATLLYADADLAGIATIEPETLVGLAREGLAFIHDKPPGRHKVRARRHGGMTLIEIANDDMPFLVDSVMAEINARGHVARLVLHPIFKVRRSAAGALEALVGPGDRNWGDGSQESYIAVHLEPIDDAATAALAEGIGRSLDDVRRAVSDWQSMVHRLGDAIAALEGHPPPVAPGLLSESLAFCRWLRDGQFTFLGMRDYRLQGDAETGELQAVPGSDLGVLRDPALHVLSREGAALALTQDARQMLFAPQPLIITKSSIVSRVHRRVLMDYVGLKRYGADGRVSGELRIVGLFTSQAYTQAPEHIPFLRSKIDAVVANCGFAPGSHAGKVLLSVLENFPRDELFRISNEKLAEWSRGIVDLDLRPRVRVFVRPDRFDRFVSGLVYIQRDRFSTVVRERIGAALAEAYNGRVSSFTPFFPEGPLVRVHFIIGRNPGPRPEVDPDRLEAHIAEITRNWNDRFASAIAALGPDTAGLGAKYARAFPGSYSESLPVTRAIEDVRRIERLGTDRPVAIDFYRPADSAPTRIRAAIYRFDAPIPLSERVPVLENMGFSVIEEQSYHVTPRFDAGPRVVTLHDMLLETADGLPIDLGAHDQRMEDTFLAVFSRAAENDPFNRLVIVAGAEWREAAVLRAYAAYLRQIRAPFGPRYIAETMTRHAGVARDLIEWFHLRHDPDRRLSMEDRAAGEEAIRKRIDSALANVASLDEDRILRHYVNLMTATVRTNFFQLGTNGAPPETIAFKIDSKAVDGLPEPKPFREIWVYSPRVEAIHMRFAPIARGGIRWSDRAQDFRTEVLGLCKAQQVKNTVIVPAGAKGGFVPKQMPRLASRDETMKEGIASYRVFISAMLDITDNIRDGKVVPPARVVRHEPDDPYLVVAADKGTATFSDFANELSEAHGFWLGDAFASGGSAGYDHKKMGITARGGWECVKRHFREMDIDIQTTPFRVTGVGDMSGDVFGNGMLLSPTIRLVAAFDHRDIFIDPDPNPAVGLAERRRLFDLPRSSWQDYDKSKLSKGGGVFPRSAKSIEPSAEMQALLGISDARLTPFELMRAILRCETDLLWFGGIGTYVRGSTETDDAAGDRANDPIRISGAELRAKVVGEGANLGLTQRGRTEFAQRGGRINADFIDNSAGVNSSDQEVNIKIALGSAVAGGRLAAADRNDFLASMTDDVAHACLVNNYEQSLALSLAERSSARDLGYLARLMRALERGGLLDRKLETLPEERDIIQRQAAGAGMARPELCVLLSQAKIAFDHELLASRVPEDPACAPLLLDYFPPALRKAFPDDIRRHRLAREIVATWITNALINRGGPTVVVRLADETGRTSADIAYAFMAVLSVFDLASLWHEIDHLDGRVGGQTQLDLYARVQSLVIDQCAGFLRLQASDPLSAVIASYRPGIEALGRGIAELASPGQRKRRDETLKIFSDAGIPEPLAARIADLDLLSYAPAISRLSRESGRPLDATARLLLAAVEYFRLDELKARAASLKVSDYYDRLAANGAIAALDAACQAVARDSLRTAGEGGASFGRWEEANGQRLARAKASLDEIAGSGEVTVSRLTVAAAQMRDLAGA